MDLVEQTYGGKGIADKKRYVHKFLYLGWNDIFHFCSNPWAKFYYKDFTSILPLKNNSTLGSPIEPKLRYGNIL